MFEELKLEAKRKIEGKFVALFFLSFSVFLCFILTFSLLIFSVYTFSQKTDIFSVPYGYYSIASFFLFFISFYFYEKVNIYKKIRYYGLFTSYIMRRGYTLKITLKYIILRLNILVRKIILLICYISPSVLIMFVMINTLIGGVDTVVFTCVACSFVLIFTFGLLCYLKEKQKFSYTDFIFFKNRNEKIKDIIKKGTLISDGHCSKILNIKLKTMKYILVCIFIVPSIYYVPLITAVQYDYLSKEKSIKREKAIVFNLPIKEYGYKSKTTWDEE